MIYTAAMKDQIQKAQQNHDENVQRKPHPLNMCLRYIQSVSSELDKRKCG